MNRLYILLSILLLALLVIAGTRIHPYTFYSENEKDPQWVSKKLASLTLREKIAQLMMIRVYSNKDQVYNKQIDDLIKKWQIGGVCFFQGGPARQAQLTNRWQKISDIPMLVAIDAEWGLGMRLDSCFSYPYQMTMGAMKSEDAVHDAAEQMGMQLKRLGVHINFAPVLDVNSNPKNPVINYRSFGEDKANVARKGLAFIHGIQSAGILATGKHFPGHGDTDSDSHYTLPVINHSESQIYETDLYPFKIAIDAGLDAVMIAHLFIPSLDTSKNTASTLSPKIVTTVLKNNLDFNGLVVTDALDMKGVTQHYKPGEIEVKAFLAGNDILLLPQNAEQAITAIENAVIQGIIKISEIDARCKKILEFKQKAGLDQYTPVELKNLYSDINPLENRLITRNIFRQSATIIKNTNNRLPVQGLDTINLAVVNIGNNDEGFSLRIQSYAKTKVFNLQPEPDVKSRQSILNRLDSFNLVIISLNSVSHNPAKDFGISKETRSFIAEISKKAKVIIDVFGNPYSVAFFDDHKNIEGILISYDKSPDSQDISAQVLFGALPATGILPVSINDMYPVNTGIETKANGAVQFRLPEEIGVRSEKMKRIDSIALSGITSKAYPGCQVLFIKDGNIFYQKSFGTFEWKKDSHKVHNSDIYDVASLTKIISTIPSLMVLQDNGKFNVEKQFQDILPELASTNKSNLPVKDVLTHQAGLQPWIRFYEKLLINKKLNPLYYSTTKKTQFPVEVANDLFIGESWRDTIYMMIDQSELLIEKTYKYSDLGYFYFEKFISGTSKTPLNQYVDQLFYKPMGMYLTGYQPLDWYPVEFIAPTENDQVFRFRQIQGFVHDQASAMLGGVAGHAGVFSNSLGIGIMMQMFLQNGYYGGRQYISKETISEYTKYQFADNRRGLGFDKPPLDNKGDGPVCKSSSVKSYGHSGFTGTYAWADPENGLVFVFLSNRVYPDADNNKINSLNIRTNIHEEMYKILNTAK